LDRSDAQLVRAIGDIQSEDGTTGALAEIGVFAGKLFALLHLLAHDGEMTVAVDLFDDQAQNIDRSGYGSNQSRFMANVDRYVGDTERVRLVAGSSLELEGTDVIELVGRVRLFSVDGGHTAVITEHDLRVAAEALVDKGVIVLDDAFNAKYPGVSDGFHSFVRAPEAGVRPFAVSVNKLFLCRQEHVDHYRKGLMRRCPRLVDREEILTGATVVIMRRLRPREVVTRTGAWQRLRDQPIGQALRELVRRLPLHRARHRS
jgi:hypothetical protein